MREGRLQETRHQAEKSIMIRRRIVRSSRLIRIFRATISLEFVEETAPSTKQFRRNADEK